MIHKHRSVSMRDLLRDPKNSLPKDGETVLLTSRGLPQYSINAVNLSASMVSGQGTDNTTVNISKDEGGALSIHEHKKEE